MRWFVEVNSIGKPDKQSYCVAADTWQRALQVARALRNDDGPMTGFSIELLDDGFSAVDPMARLRYLVKQAPEDSPLTETPKADAAASSVKSVPPPARPVSHAPAATAKAPPASDTTRDLPNPPSLSTPPGVPSRRKTAWVDAPAVDEDALVERAP